MSRAPGVLIRVDRCFAAGGDEFCCEIPGSVLWLDLPGLMGILFRSAIMTLRFTHVVIGRLLAGHSERDIIGHRPETHVHESTVYLPLCDRFDIIGLTPDSPQDDAGIRQASKDRKRARIDTATYDNVEQ